MNLRKLKNQAGFTLVELIVVIAIMAILAGVAVPVYSGYIEKANLAADQQLLGAVNSAFAAACVENNSDAYAVNNAGLTYGGKRGAVTITGISNVTAAGLDKATVNEAFQRYYSGNEGSVFKATEQLKFNKETHLFEIFSTDSLRNAVDTYNKSNLEGKAQELAGSVETLTGMLAGTISDEEFDYAIFFGGDEEYSAFLSEYGLNTESDPEAIANATVMYVANAMSGVTAQDIIALTEGKITNTDPVLNKYGTLPTSALMYGIVTGYANSEHASAEFKEAYSKAPTGLTDVTKLMESMQKDSGFTAYTNAPDKNLVADMDGYLAAMDVISNYEGNFDLTDTDLFTDESTQKLLENILSSNS